MEQRGPETTKKSNHDYMVAAGKLTCKLRRGCKEQAKERSRAVRLPRATGLGSCGEGENGTPGSMYSQMQETKQTSTREQLGSPFAECTTERVAEMTAREARRRMMLCVAEHVGEAVGGWMTKQNQNVRNLGKHGSGVCGRTK